MGSSSYQRAQSQTVSFIDLVGCSREVRGHKVVEPEDGNGAVVNGEFVEFVGFKHAGRVLTENPLDIGTATTIASFAHALDCFAHAVLELMD
uniref:Uncharacterized protein n=1 Tax=Fagus sylvatica TaxID=28930 RepID=A0A2N9EG00_FAGSY